MYSQSSQNMGAGWQPIKLRDLGDGTFAVAHINIPAWEKAHVAGAGTTVAKAGPGILGGIMVNKAVSLSTITVYDNTVASGTIVGIMTHPLTLLQNQYFVPITCRMDTGITVVTSAGDDITVMYL